MKKLKSLKFNLKIYPSDKEEYMACINDLISHENVQIMRKFNHHGTVTCFDHSIHVSVYSFIICKHMGLRYRSAARGALLHDLFLYDWRTTKLEQGKHGFVHPKIALENSVKLFDLNPVEKDIIVKHMFPLTLCPPMYIESTIVCLVDKLCATLELLGMRYHYI